MAAEILYEDRHLVVCVKPVGILSEEGGMPDLLQTQLKVARIFCVHRLDRAVGGVMVYAKDGKTAAKLSEMISGHAVTKEYLTVVHGVPEETRGEMHDLLYHDNARNKSFVVTRERRGVKDASLEYEVLETITTENGKQSLVHIRLHTGRSHQIRVQFSSRRMPLIGDGKYGSTAKDVNIALWSHKLTFSHPVTNRPIEISALPPAEAPWTQFGLHKNAPTKEN